MTGEAPRYEEQWTFYFLFNNQNYFISNKSRNRREGRLKKMFIMVTTLYDCFTKINDIIKLKKKSNDDKNTAKFWVVWFL